jgi:hypothetical protein
MMHKNRWLVYALIGLAFGVFDWYYLNLLARFPWGSLGNSPIVIPIIIGLNYGIWLVPVLPVTYYESRQSLSKRNAALSGALCWSCSILSYYIYYTLLLAFWGLPNMDHLLVLGEKGAGFSQEWNMAFQRIILDQVIEWLPVALVGGALMGLITWKINSHRLNLKESAKRMEMDNVSG